ncbi:AAA+-type ATPase [Phyllosticta paracitricarpa]|uniref:AAA+-type ATPase n=1 Tax=Phyllosticta paracitricarpa TaxID=2016321 RepID=A0ABR1NFF1_9PEZI
MAFQTPVSLQGVASVTREIWPSFSAAIRAPWRSLTSQQPSSSHAEATRPTIEAYEPTTTKNVSHPAAPDILASVPKSSLQFRTMPVVPGAAPTVAGIFSQVSSITFRSMSTQPSTSSYNTTRLYSTRTTLGPFRLGAIPQSQKFGFAQCRSFFGNSNSAHTSQNVLAHMEQQANNNPQSASAQNAFYAALLRANLPQFVVARYETGRYATNASCDAMYARALEKLGQTENAGGQQSHMNDMGQSSGLSKEGLQAIGQAVGARVRGSNVATARTGNGSKSSPLHVVVEEKGGRFLKWFKFLAWVVVCVWAIQTAFVLFVDLTGGLARRGAVKDSEAKPQMQKTRFSDVHGCDEAKEELQDVVDFLKNPGKFNNLGGKLPKGVLLVGPPGTGKTLLARAVAGEAGVPFFQMSGAEFDEIYVGVGAKRVRELFGQAKSKAPAIVFIDELDAVGSKRNERDNAAAKQTLNQLLTELDGFEQNSGIILIAATNFPELLDKALVRPGRFDRHVVVDLPDVRGRISIIRHHMRKVQAGTDVDPALLARGTPGFSGAELENMVNQAAVHASKKRQQRVSMLDFEWAKDKILMGAERRSRFIPEDQKLATAYHEGGHALVNLYTKHSEPLYKATIMPRGHALGLTMWLPEMDKYSKSKAQFLAQIDMSMGGKAAEEIFHGPEHVTSGASEDIRQATKIAYAMVTQLGMSSLGNIDLDSQYQRLSTDTKNKIEVEVRKILDEAYERARNILNEKRVELDRLAKGLVEYECLSREEMEKIIKGEKLPEKPKSDEGAPIKLPEMLIPKIPGNGGHEPGPPSAPAPGTSISG